MLAYLPTGRSIASPRFMLLMVPREEAEPWILGISGSKYRKSRSWENARDFYNARLAANAVEVLP